jgi:hypothetical protein
LAWFKEFGSEFGQFGNWIRSRNVGLGMDVALGFRIRSVESAMEIGQVMNLGWAVKGFGDVNV